jgi:hypothetical protein
MLFIDWTKYGYAWLGALVPTLIAAAIAAIVTLSDLSRTRSLPPSGSAAAPSRSSEIGPSDDASGQPSADGPPARKRDIAAAAPRHLLPLILLLGSGKRTFDQLP